MENKRPPEWLLNLCLISFVVPWWVPLMIWFEWFGYCLPAVLIGALLWALENWHKNAVATEQQRERDAEERMRQWVAGENDI